MKSYTTSRNLTGINRNIAVSENGNPRRLNIRRVAVERSSTRPSSTTMIEPTPPSGRPACRKNSAPRSDCRAVNRKTSLRSNRSKKSTQRLQNPHSPSKTTTACREEFTTLLSQAELLSSPMQPQQHIEGVRISASRCPQFRGNPNDGTDRRIPDT
jgi:hypothetical protein